jgi:DHA3 family multidrug efflux protein-like MFS transporter
VESDAGKQAFGWLLGEGAARGIALTFVVAGAFMLLLSILAFRTKAYHILSASYKRNIDRGE